MLSVYGDIMEITIVSNTFLVFVVMFEKISPICQVWQFTASYTGTVIHKRKLVLIIIAYI